MGRSFVASSAWLMRRVLDVLSVVRGLSSHLSRPLYASRRLWILIALFLAVNLSLAFASSFDRVGWGTAVLACVVNGSLFVCYRYGRRHSGKIVVSIVVSFSLFAANLFGYRTVLDHYGEQLFFALFATYGEGARERSVVVLLKDKDLKDLELPWPMPYAEHQAVLERIRSAAPRAVMIDFLFIDRRRNDDTLGKLVGELQDYQRANIPVFLAYPVDPDAKVLDGLRANARMVLVPRFVDDERHNLYPLSLDWWIRDGDEEPRRVWRRTAAAELCVSDPACAKTFSKIDDEMAKVEDLVVVWGRATGCATDGSRREDCPFTSTVSVTQVRRRWREVEPLIKNRVVFYGAQLEGSPDLVRRPLQEPIAGVYAHAMAFDNLVSYGQSYKREVTRDVWFCQHCSLTRTAQGLIVITAPILCLWPALLFRGWRWSRTRPVLALGLSTLLYSGLALGYVLAVSNYEFKWLNAIPGNWLEGVVEVVVGVSATDLLAPRLEAYLDSLTGVRSEHEA